MTVAADTVALDIIFQGLLLMVLSIMMKKSLLPNNIPSLRVEYKNHTLFMTKTAEKPYPLGPHIPI